MEISSLPAHDMMKEATRVRENVELSEDKTAELDMNQTMTHAIQAPRQREEKYIKEEHIVDRSDHDRRQTGIELKFANSEVYIGTSDAAQNSYGTLSNNNPIQATARSEHQREGEDACEIDDKHRVSDQISTAPIVAAEVQLGANDVCLIEDRPIASHSFAAKHTFTEDITRAGRDETDASKFDKQEMLEHARALHATARATGQDAQQCHTTPATLMHILVKLQKR